MTAIDQGAGPMLRCPACGVEHPLDETWLGQVIDCPGCGARLEIVEPSALGAGPALHLSSPPAEPEAPIRVLAGHTEAVWAVACSPDGSRIVSASRDETLKIWDAASGAELLTLMGHADSVCAVAYSLDGTRIVSGSLDETLIIWDAVSGAQLDRITGHGGAVCAVAYSSDGTRIVSGSADKTLKLWDAANGKRLATLSGHAYGVNAVACSPDGSRIVSASGTYSENYIREEDCALVLWDASKGKRVATFPGHRNVVRAVAYSPDGIRIISGSDDWTVRVWDAASGVQLADFLGHEGPVQTVAYSPDGNRIVSGSADGSIKVWEADTFTESHTFHHPPDGVQITTLRGQAEGVTALAYSPDGSRIVSGSVDHTLKIWDAAIKHDP